MSRWLGGFRHTTAAARITAILLAIAALSLRLSLHSFLGAKAPYITFFLACTASAALGGFSSGILTAITGALLAGFVVPAGGWLHLIDPADRFGVARYLVSAGFVSWICEVLISSRERAETAERRLRESEIMLLRQAEALKRSNRDLEQFAFVAAHDMREPLRAVNIYTELLIGSDAGSAERDQYATFIKNGVERMERLIADLLNYSLVVHSEVEAIPVDTRKAALEALKNSDSLIQSSGAEVVIEALPIVLATEAHMIQLFQNLLSNAIKYRKESVASRIHISAAAQNGQATIRVADNGIGFEQQYAGKVFKLFTRLHGNGYEGTGVGLAICQRIVERYGGNIRVESEPGEGSTFFITLPAAHSARAQTQVENQASPSGYSDPAPGRRTPRPARS